MCKLKSLILLKDRVFCPDYDSHDKMLKELGIEDTKENAERLFVRAEVSLRPFETIDLYDTRRLLDINKWVFRVDQDILPDWYVKEVDEERARNTVKEWAKTHIITGNVQEINSGRGYIICGNAKVAKICDNAEVSEICGNAHVSEICNKAKVTKICDNAEVSEIYDFAHVSEIYDGAKVSEICGCANVYNIYGDAKVSYIGDYAHVYSIYGDAEVSYIGDYAKVSYIGEDAKVSYIGGNAMVCKIFCNAKVSNIYSNAIVRGELREVIQHINGKAIFITENCIYCSEEYEIVREKADESN